MLALVSLVFLADANDDTVLRVHNLEKLCNILRSLVQPLNKKPARAKGHRVKETQCMDDIAPSI